MIIKRKAKRLAVNVSVGWSGHTTHRPTSAAAFLLRARNLNQNGLFVKSDRILPVGSRLTLDIVLVNGEPPLRVAGKVAWIADPQRHPAYYPGMGVQFVGVPLTARRLISAFIHEKMRNFRDAQELKRMYLRLKEMAARLVEIEEQHPRASQFRKAIDSAIQEIEDVAHMIDREVREVRNL
jgi:Tfp pilus assembly protein PilZ